MAVAADTWRDADEHRHPSGPDPGWYESFGFDFHSAEGSFGGYIRLTLVPELGQAWYWAAVVGRDRPLVTLVEHGAPVPTVSPRSLEIRTDGLWADHNVEEPFERWSLGLEAFAVRVDDPADALSGAYGEVIPLGFDMEWERDGLLHTSAAGDPRGAGYAIASKVHGELLIGRNEAIDFEGAGFRHHHWGPLPWMVGPWSWAGMRFDDGTSFDAPVAHTTSSVESGTVVSLAGRRVEVVTALPAPVHVVGPEGVEAHLRRTLVRVRTDTGTGGTGWIDENRVVRTTRE